MPQTTCRVITIVNSLYINDVTGKNPRLFEPQDQYPIAGTFTPLFEGECDQGCAYGIITRSIGPGDFTDEVPENWHLQMNLSMINLCTGEELTREGTITINGTKYSLGNEYYVLSRGLNTVLVEMKYGDITLQMKSYYNKEKSNVVDAQWTSVSPLNTPELSYPIFTFGNTVSFKPKIGVTIPVKDERLIVIGMIKLLNRIAYKYEDNGTYTQRYSAAGKYGVSFTELSQPVSNCPKKDTCCGPRKYYVVTCNGNNYNIPVEDAVETINVIPIADRNIHKQLAEVILHPPNGIEPEANFRPDPRKITKDTNTVYM